MKKIIWPIAIILGALILGFSIIASQGMKQGSIERQKRMEIEQENKLEETERTAILMNKIDLENCLETANENYWIYVKINGTENEDGTVWALNDVWDRAAKTKKAEEDVCFKKFK